MSASVSRPIRTMVSVSLALLFAGPGIAVAQRIEVEGRAWIPEISARAKIEGGSSSPGTPIDLGRDLGIDTEPLPELRLSIFTGPNSRLRLAYTHGRWDGDAIIGQGIEFNGTQFPAASRVVSDLDLHYARLGWIWQPWLIPDRLRLGPHPGSQGLRGGDDARSSRARASAEGDRARHRRRPHDRRCGGLPDEFRDQPVSRSLGAERGPSRVRGRRRDRREGHREPVPQRRRRVSLLRDPRRGAAELCAPAALRAVRRRQPQVLSAVKGPRVDSVTSGGM